MRKLLLLILVSVLSIQLFPQENPKREFRAVWIATVNRLDWPPNFNPVSQRNAYINILNTHMASGINAVVSQIRPACDAFYPSDIEPWSQWLTGTQGVAPNPIYDPLEFQITEAHKRGMEYHAWFNPYRAVVDINNNSISPNHVTVTHPEWIREYGNLRLLDPGLPEVREYVVSVIMDVVRRYNIDGVHFDDYFYPYPSSGVEFKDSTTFANYPNGYTDKDDWRRNNVNLLIEMVHDSINAVKPWVKFGISPFGIWRNQSSDINGSATAGFESYSGIYADSRKWVQEGWIDYINPQIYWNIGFSVADFQILANWWSDNSYGRNVYAGHAVYKINTTAEWSNPSEMPDQIRLTRELENVHGSVFFRANFVANNLNGFQDSLRNNLYKTPALRPLMPWIDSIPPLKPVNLQASMDQARVTLTWELPDTAADDDTAAQFVIYRFDYPDTIDLSNPKFIRFISYNDTTRFFDAKPIDTLNQNVTYVVTSLDRIQNESKDFASVNILLTGAKDEHQLVYDYSLDQNYPNPFNPSTKIRFNIAEEGSASLKVYDLLGKEVAVLVNEEKSPGKYEVEFDASELSSGIYFYQLKAGGVTLRNKMIFMK